MKKRKSILTSIVNLASTMVLKSPKTRAMTVLEHSDSRETVPAARLDAPERRDPYPARRPSRHMRRPGHARLPVKAFPQCAPLFPLFYVRISL